MGLAYYTKAQYESTLLKGKNFVKIPRELLRPIDKHQRDLK